jgi:hypothetical protein
MFLHHTLQLDPKTVITRSSHTLSRPIVRLVLFFLLLAKMGLEGQEALRISMAGDVAAAERKQAASSVGYYNLLWGALSLRCSAALAGEYTDNVHNSSSSGEDFIVRPSINTQLHWPVTIQNALDISVGAGYSFYQQHPQLNQFFLTPNSGVSFDVYIGDWVINLHDRATLTENNYENPTTTNGVNRTYFQNTIGISGLWDLNKAMLSFGYDHVNYMMLGSSGNSQPDSTSENFYVNAGIRPRQEILIGLQGGLGLVSYDQSSSSNSVSSLPQNALQVNAGIFSSVQLSQLFSARVDAGYTVYMPDSVGTNAASQSDSLYFQLSLTHQVNEHVKYSLSAGHSVDFAYNSQPYDRYYVRLTPTWNVIYKWDLGASLAWEQGTQIGLNSMTYDQYSAGINLGRRLTQKITGSMYYRWVKETSDQATLNYTQNIVGLSLNYQF